MSRHRHESRERLIRPESTTILMPEVSILDLPYIPVMWGAFDPNVFTTNRNRLLALPGTFQLTHSQREVLNLLSGKNLASVDKLIRNFEQWTEVTDNLINGLGLTDYPDLTKDIDPPTFTRVMREHLQKAKGDIVVMGRPHSILFPTHAALRKEMIEPENTRVAEIVFDQHIDAVINPGVDFVTSGNVYSFLSSSGLLVAPVIFGPDAGLINTFKKIGGDKKISKIVVVESSGMSEAQKKEVIKEVLNGFKRWGVTNVTFTVDLDVLSESEKAFSVRYSPVVPYLGLGCQILPDELTPEHLIALKQLKFPTPHVRFFLQHEQIRQSQQLQYARQFTNANVDGDVPFTSGTLSTDLGKGKGLKMEEVLSMIRLLKEEMPKYGIKDGIRLKGGGTYRGAVVEMCGFEDDEKNTSKAAIKVRQAIIS